MSLPIYVIGHKNPDTDSICAALALAELKRQTGVNAVAARLGTLNPETKFILDKFLLAETIKGVDSPTPLPNNCV